ncbi:hypothetical protein MKX03_024560 [Papaver bracteatum]|nr:hypothetical protein MKX03_024560 [Papaver bracteatum]
MWKHFNRCKKNPNKPKPKGQQTLTLKCATLGKDDGKLVNTIFSQDKCKRAVVEFIIIDEMPFRAVEGEGFRRMMHVLEPRFVVPSRMTIYRCLLEIYVDEKEKLKNYFKSSKQRVSLTTDTWTSPNNFNYICVTVHFIDQHWKLEKRIIMFCEVSGHKGIDIGEMLEKCLSDWGLKDVFSVTLDNASSNNVAMDYLTTSIVSMTRAEERAKYLHVRCAAHVLALVVKDAVRVYNKSIARIRSVVKYIKGSPARRGKLRHCANLVGIESKIALILDVKTRWNSTFLMLQAALVFERAFTRLERYDREYQKMFYFPTKDSEKDLPNADDFDIDINVGEEEEEFSEEEQEEQEEQDDVRGKKKAQKKKKKKVIVKKPAPCQEDWIFARGLVKCLKVFFDATAAFSASTQVTTHTFLWQLVLIYEQLVEFRENVDEDPFITTMAAKMFKKYNKYWGDYAKMNSITFFAMLLDPREKEKGLEFALECLYGKKSPKVELVMRSVMLDFKILFEEYKDVYNSVHEEVSSTFMQGQAKSVASKLGTGAAGPSRMKELMSRSKRHKSNPDDDVGKTELDRYFIDKFEEGEGEDGDDDEFDLLGWWKTNINKYRILGHMAKDILAIPVSSVASESAFSTGKRVLSPCRSSLSTRTVEALLCTQSWLRKPIQLDLLCDYLPDDDVEVEEEILGPIKHTATTTSAAME